MTMTLNTDIPSVLQRIVATKIEEVAAAKQTQPLAVLKAQTAADTRPRRGFAQALRNSDLGIIAEIKKASPSKGVINHNFAPALFAQQYEQAAGRLKELIEAHTQSIWIDDAIFMLADLYENSLNNKEAAKALYQQLITDHPGSMLNAEARKRYRSLRGDNVGT